MRDYHNFKQKAGKHQFMGLSEELFILVIFIFLSAFFSGVETAFTSLSSIRIQYLVENKRKGIKLVKTLKDNNQRLIITILIGNNLVNITASSVATSVAIDIFQSNALGIAVGVMTIVILIFGEIIPKNIALVKNEWIAIASAPVIRILEYVLFPIIKLLEWFTMFISKPIRGKNVEPIITEEEIKTVVNLGEEIGEVEEDECMMIHNIFRFSDLEASEIMTDRTQIFSINANKKLKDITPDIMKKGYSRIPVYEKKVDNMVGILYLKDVLQSILASKDDLSVKELARPAMFIPQTILIDDLLREFQKEKVHIALVVDEHGGISGLITIEDLIEEIVGDIYDETDKEQTMIKKIDKNKSIVKGETEIEIVNKVLSINLSEEGDYETISGFILAKLRHIPEIDEELKIGNNIIRIINADQQRIIEVEIENIEPEK
ncbi:putative hemolysin [Candidatus Magnetomoraceae bacterium gMMP-15]